MSDSKTVPRGGGDPSGRDAKRINPALFIRQVIAELRKVVWPTKDQLVTYFIVVMVFVIVMMAIISALDLGFGKLVFAIFAGNG